MDLPEIANQTSADTRQALAELAREMTVCKGGIDMLGSVARKELSARVQASGIGPQAMQKRATKVHMLVDRVIAFSRESGCPKRVHMAWTLLARAAAAALTYDARLVPRETLEITSKELERHIHGAVCGLLGDELDEHAMRRMVLPGALGGCGLRMDAVGLAADAAFWSTWAMTVKVVPGVAKDAGLGKVSNADELAAAAARRRLAEAGVEVDADGRVAFSQVQRNMYAASPWNHDLPVSGNSLMIGPAAEDNEELAVTGLPRKFASRIHRHVEALAAVSLWNDAGEEVRRIMLSAGGKGSGSDWIAVPTSWNDWWDEAEFVTATRLRLASLKTPVATPCRLVNKSTGEPCGHLMRGIVTHSQVCRCGPARQRAHIALKRMMGC